MASEINKVDQLTEFLLNSKSAFINGKYQESFYLAKEPFRRTFRQ